MLDWSAELDDVVGSKMCEYSKDRQPDDAKCVKIGKKNVYFVFQAGGKCVFLFFNGVSASCLSTKSRANQRMHKGKPTPPIAKSGCALRFPPRGEFDISQFTIDR